MSTEEHTTGAPAEDAPTDDGLEQLIAEEVVIEFDVTAYHDVRVLKENEQVAEGTPLVSVERDGETRTAVRELRTPEAGGGEGDPVTTTTIRIPAEDARRMVRDARAVNPSADWRRVLSNHVERAVMPFHAPQSAWREVRASIPALETYMRAVFFA